MKSLYTLVLAICLAGTVPGLAGAAISDAASGREAAGSMPRDPQQGAAVNSQADREKTEAAAQPSPGQPDRGRVPEKGHTGGSNAGSKPLRPNTLRNNSRNEKSRNAAKANPAAAGKLPGATAQGTPTKPATANLAPPARQPNLARSTGPPRATVRHLNSNPPVIGGRANPRGANTAALNGTGMRGRP